MTTFQQVRERLRLGRVQGMFLTDEERSRLDGEIDEILGVITEASNIDEADSKLQELGTMQETLATLSFKYRIELTQKQRKLVRRYDRWDDSRLRTSAFEDIRRGHFP